MRGHQGCGKSGSQEIKLQTEYQAVLLVGGQAFFGKVDQQGPDWILLKDVYYIQRLANQETKQVANQLIKRGVQEWHSPDAMYINTRQIVLVEPVAPTSQVAKLIKEAKAKEGTK